VDTWTLFDNSASEPRLIARVDAGEIVVADAPLFEKIKEGIK